MKVSVIISACGNRQVLFSHSLDTWIKQTLPKEEFEIVIVDDFLRIEYDSLCEKYSQMGLNFQLVRIDRQKNKIVPKTFIPVLTNNIGIKMARGEVIVITNPETLQKETNLEESYKMKDKRECAYGLVFKANKESTSHLKENWTQIKENNFQDILNVRGTQAECLTTPPHPPAYLYYMAVNKKYAIDIGGFDERFLEGLCAEDDDFANRMKMFGINPVFNYKIMGVHQDHSGNDNNDNIHVSRYSEEGKKLWEHNKKIMQQNMLEKNIVVNKLNGWGDMSIITSHQIFGGK